MGGKVKAKRVDAVPIGEILASAVADRQAGVERFSCGCVLGSGALVNPCPAVREASRRHGEYFSRLWELDADGRAEMVACQATVAAHIRSERAIVSKAKRGA